MERPLAILACILDSDDGGESRVAEDGSGSSVARKGVLTALAENAESAFGEIVERDVRVVEQEVVFDAELSGGCDELLRALCVEWAVRVRVEQAV